MIRIKRVYEPSSRRDGRRVLVDRLWPRGLSKEKARVDVWAKGIAPSTRLRQWYGHDPAKWAEFKSRYAAELKKRKSAAEEFLRELRSGPVTFLFASKERRLNNAAALKDYIVSKR